MGIETYCELAGPVVDAVGAWDEDWLTYEMEDTALLSVACDVGFDAKLDVPN